MSEKMKKCLESWRVFCPDWEIIEWNQTNFDMSKSPILKIALENRRWALAADIIRIFALYENGGVYLDTDVEIIKDPTRFLEHEFFLGYETVASTGTAIIGSAKGHPILKRICDLYSSPVCLPILKTILIDVQLPLVVAHKMYGAPLWNKNFISESGGVAIYKKDWFYPKSTTTTKLKVTKNTHMIHYYEATWVKKYLKRIFKVVAPILKCPLLYPFVAFGEWVGARKLQRKTRRLLKKYDKSVGG
jgi:mannosyltransferase OCH1-like enzyme